VRFIYGPRKKTFPFSYVWTGMLTQGIKRRRHSNLWFANCGAQGTGETRCHFAPFVTGKKKTDRADLEMGAGRLGRMLYLNQTNRSIVAQCALAGAQEAANSRSYGNENPARIALQQSARTLMTDILEIRRDSFFALDLSVGVYLLVNRRVPPASFSFGRSRKEGFWEVELGKERKGKVEESFPQTFAGL